MQVVSLTEKGQQLARRLSGFSPTVQCLHKPKPFIQHVQDLFLAGEPLILICATGIAVRTLAPVLRDKYRDPPVLVLDELGRFVIPLLSGHEGGANALAAKVADYLQAQLVMTTANTYTYPVYAVGMGCERGCPRSDLRELLLACLEQARLKLSDIQSLNSITLKADEVGLITLAQDLGKPFLTWEASVLRSVEHKLSQRSDYVFGVTGVFGVAESAALYALEQQYQQPAELKLSKQKTKRATCAIARCYPSDAKMGNA